MHTDNAPWAEEHRTVLVGLLLITVVLFVLGAAQIVRSIGAPFTAPTGAYKTVEQVRQEEIAALKVRDTDSDGLSDYDELNIYLTSPYLTDTDSDGVPDGEEVRSGDDPNCPRGQNCGSGASQVGPRQASPQDLTSAPGSRPGSVTPISGNTFVGLTPENLETLDVVQVRSLLRGAGVPEEVLASFSDEEIMTLFRETLAKNNPLGAASSTPQ
ncbi:MAG: thrombospondin type 3 repeat-containing protein [Patescibacteria group bacterium]